MQYCRDAVRSVWNKCRGSVHRTVQPIWNMLYWVYSKVSSAGKQPKIYFDSFYTAYFHQRKIIQDGLDRLSNHSSAGYAIVVIVNFAAIVFKSVVAVECFYHFRPYYWMIMNFLISLFYSSLMFTGRGAGAILKFLVIITIRLTSRIFVGLTTNALIAFHGVIHVSKLLITPVTSPAIVSRNEWKFILQLCFLCGVIVTLTLLWRRRVANPSDSSTAVLPDSPPTRKKRDPGNEVDSHLRNGRRSMPFSWQFKETDSYLWRNFGPSDNVAMERLYCDVEKLEIKMVLKDTPSRHLMNVSSTMMTANFEQMSMKLDTSAQFLLRRLSTPSYIQEPGNELSTKWIWYWQDDDGWKKYSPMKQSSGTKQEDIEAAYLKEEQMYFFQIGTCNYIITFYETSMYQRNMDRRYLTKRRVRRRPLFASESVLQVLNLYCSELKGQDMDFERITLQRDGEQFKAVSKRFHVTIPECKASILMVEKINNDFLHERYNRKREQMKKKRKASNYEEIEKLLFHGTTSDVIDAICKQNFDHRLRGKNGTRYGEGSYFAVAASYSNNYSSQSREKTRFMFLASVLTGEYKLGGRELRRPPLKDPSNPASDLYDSCVDKEYQPTIFVIFNDEQCYPLYLIKYRLREL